MEYNCSAEDHVRNHTRASAIERHFYRWLEHSCNARLELFLRNANCNKQYRTGTSIYLNCVKAEHKMCREIKIKREGSRYVHVMIRCAHALYT